MFYVFSKVFSFLCFPIAWIVILLVVSVFLKNKRLKKRIVISSVLALLLLTNPLFTNWVYHAWSSAQYKPFPQEVVYDCAIIAGGFSDYNSHTEQWDLNQNADRMIEPIRLYQKGVVKRLLISGDGASNNLEGESTVAGFRQVMQDLGVDLSDVLIEQKARNTHENALFTKTFLANRPEVSNLLLVTSGFHAYRTKLCYDKVGLRTTLFVTDVPNIERWSWRLLFPDWNTIMRWNELFHEWIGLLTYKIVGYI